MPGMDDLIFDTIMTTLAGMPVDTLAGSDEDGARLFLKLVDPDAAAEFSIESLANFTLPAGALDSQKTVRMIEIKGEVLRNAARGIAGREREGTGIVGVDLDAEGSDVNFVTPASLVLQYPDANNDGKEDAFGVSESNLAVFHKANTETSWKETVAKQDTAKNTFTITAQQTGSYVVARALSGSGVAGSVQVTVAMAKSTLKAGDTLKVSISALGSATAADVYLVLNLQGTNICVRGKNDFYPAGTFAPLASYKGVRLPDAAPNNLVLMDFPIPAGLEGLQFSWIAGVIDSTAPLSNLGSRLPSGFWTAR